MFCNQFFFFKSLLPVRCINTESGTTNSKKLDFKLQVNSGQRSYNLTLAWSIHEISLALVLTASVLGAHYAEVSVSSLGKRN